MNRPGSRFVAVAAALLWAAPAWAGPADAASAAGGDAPDPAAFALVVGSNAGGNAQAPLRYAESDARHVAALLRELGGYRPDHVQLALHPTRAELYAALDVLTARAVTEAGAGRRPRVFFYYSGHARSSALNLGAEDVPLAELRERLIGLSDGLTIVVLDACQSGSFSRVKGAEPHGRLLVQLALAAERDRRRGAGLVERQRAEPGVGSPRLRLLHPPPACRPARRRRRQRRRQGLARRGLPLRLPPDPAGHRGHAGRRAAREPRGRAARQGRGADHHAGGGRRTARAGRRARRRGAGRAAHGARGGGRAAQGGRHRDPAGPARGELQRPRAGAARRPSAPLRRRAGPRPGDAPGGRALRAGAAGRDRGARRQLVRAALVGGAGHRRAGGARR